jgi:transposase
VPGPLTIGLEATLYWDWLTTQLTEHGHTVRVAHAFHVTRIWQARAKTEPIDARKLAELLRVNLFPVIWIPDLDTRRRCHLRSSAVSCSNTMTVQHPSPSRVLWCPPSVTPPSGIPQQQDL